MSPTAKNLEVMAGNGVRLNTSLLNPGANPKEVFYVRSAPPPGSDGILKLESKLTPTKLSISASEDVLTEKVD